jgi:hypothetical protein
MSVHQIEFGDQRQSRLTALHTVTCSKIPAFLIKRKSRSHFRRLTTHINLRYLDPIFQFRAYRLKRRQLISLLSRSFDGSSDIFV